MKKDLKKNNEKKILRKVKKNWVVMAVATFAITGSASVIGTHSVTAAASDTVQNNTSNSTDGSEVQATGQWGTVNFTFTKDGTLTLKGNGTLSMDFPASVNKDAVTKIVFNDTVKLPVKSTRLLGDFHNLKEFVGLDKVDASDMEYSDGLFVEDHSIESIDISSWKTPKLTYALEMFAGDHSVKTINVTGLDTSNVTNMQEMFAHSYNLTNIIGLNTLDVSNVTVFDYFVAWDVSLPSLDISNFKTVNNPSLLNMFYATPSLKSINIAGFDNSNSNNTRSFDLAPGYEDPGSYPSNIDDSKSQLSSVVTGPGMDLSKMAFQSAVSDMNYYKLVNGQAVLNDSTRPASSNWVASVIKVVDRDHPDQVFSTLLFQGVPGSSVNVNIPSGYGLDKNSTQTITLGNQTVQDAEVKVYKPGTEPDSNSSSSSSEASSSASSSDSSASSSQISSASSSSASSSESGASSSATSSSSASSNESSAQSSSAASSAASSSQSSASSSASSSTSSANSSASSDGVIDNHNNNTGKPNTNTNKHHQSGHKTNTTTKPSANVNTNHQSELPQTGQRSTKAAEIFGLVLIVLSLGLVAFHRHDHHKR